MTQICRRCVMDTSDPAIEFDSNGICSHCRNYERLADIFLSKGPDSEIRLKKLLHRIRKSGKNKPYDCIIGVSGGVDSSYVAHLVKQEFDLRPLAVHLDNGWNSNLAVSNIKSLLNDLQIDLVTEILDWREFRGLQKAFLLSSTPDLEIPTDHAITAVLMRVANEHKIKFILGGSNVASEAIMPAAWSQGIRDFRYIKSVNELHGTGSLSTYPFFTYSQFAMNKFRGQRWIDILNYVTYNKEEAVQTLTSHYGWTPYASKHGESIYTRFLQNCYLPEKFGADKRKGHLSSLICSGQLSRTKALSLLQEPIATPEEIRSDTSYVLKKLGISDQEFDVIMASPKKSMHDYPNTQKLLIFRISQIIYRRTRNSVVRLQNFRSS